MPIFPLAFQPRQCVLFWPPERPYQLSQSLSGPGLRLQDAQEVMAQTHDSYLQCLHAHIDRER